jgi:hypothetical protein
MAEKKEDDKEQYKSIAEETFDETEKGRQTISVAETAGGTKIIGFRKFFKSKKDGKEEITPRRGKSFFIPVTKLQPLTRVLLGIARRFGFKVEEPDLEKKIGELNAKIEQLNQQISTLESEKVDAERMKIDYEKKLDEAKKQVIKSNLGRFRKDLKDFEQKLDQASKGSIREEEVQQFLKDRPWIFGVEYIKSEPKKPAGSTSIFDFYLLDYRNHGIIIELKLPSEKIFGEERYALTTKASESIGQLIRYMETTSDISSSVGMSEGEGIKERKPLGYLVIGRTESEDIANRLHVINSFLHRIEIESYDDLLAKAENALATFSQPTPT